jgi:hypothetical protein
MTLRGTISESLLREMRLNKAKLQAARRWRTSSYYLASISAAIRLFLS